MDCSLIAAASAPIHVWIAQVPKQCTYQCFPRVLLTIIPQYVTICFPSHFLLSHTTIVETMNSGERGMNPVAMTIINPRKEYWPSRRSNQRPPFLKSDTLPTELWGLANRYRQEALF